MDSYKWGYKSPKMGYNSSYPTYNPTGFLNKLELGFGAHYTIIIIRNRQNSIGDY